MKIGIMISDITNSLLRKPVTEKYPYERRVQPPSLRGALKWNAKECTGCGVCTMDCPSSAIDVVVLDKKEKHFVMKYHLDRCTFCAQCTNSCRQGCLEMSNDQWELAVLDIAQCLHYYGDKDDVERVMDGNIE